MVNELFQTVLGMSLTGTVVILLVLVARLILRGAPRVFSYALWAVVLVRLLCPFTPESALSLVPSARIVEAPGIGGTTAEIFEVSTGIPAVDDGINDFFATHPYQGYVPAELPPDGPLPVIPQTGDVPDWRTVPAILWLTGGGALLAYSVISLVRLRRRLVGAVPLDGEASVLLADHIDTPFVLGLFRPRIYLPSALPEGEREYVLLHERTHIRRLDHVTRALAWLALCLHWFDPLVWLAFHLAGRDMEASCDEAVLRRAGRDVRADYAASLLRLSAGKKLPVGPLAFGDGDPQSRIKNVLNYKNPAFWVTVIALAAVVVAGVVLITGRPFPGAVGPGRPLVAWIEDDVTEVKITHFAGGQATEWSVKGGGLKPLRAWVNGLTYEPAEFEDGNTPGDTEGGEVYSFELTGGAYSDFDYIINGADRYVLIEGHWLVILNPSEPPVSEPASDPAVNEPGPGGEHFFNAVVLEDRGGSLLTEVSGGFNSGLSAGARVTVTKDVFSPGNYPDGLEVGDAVRVVFNGLVMETDPAQLGTVFAVYLLDENGVAAPNRGLSDPVDTFSWAEVKAEYGAGGPGIKTDGFHNMTPATVSGPADAARLAEVECTVEYDAVSVRRDAGTDMWAVNFYTAGTLGGDETVYLDGDGVTRLIVYGE